MLELGSFPCSGHSFRLPRRIPTIPFLAHSPPALPSHHPVLLSYPPSSCRFRPPYPLLISVARCGRTGPTFSTRRKHHKQGWPRRRSGVIAMSAVILSPLVDPPHRLPRSSPRRSRVTASLPLLCASDLPDIDYPCLEFLVHGTNL